LSIYQTPETYTKQFIERVLSSIKNIQFYEEMKVTNIRLQADYGVENIVIEAEAPCNRERGRKQLEEHMKKFNRNFGILIDIPVERYYEEYPNPCRGKVGFELYMKFGERCEPMYYKEYEKDEIKRAEEELKNLIELLKRFHLIKEAARVKPTPEILITKVNALVEKYLRELKNMILGTSERTKLYFKIWNTNMELIYGKEVLNTIKNLEELFIRLTIYVTWLKFLGATLLEATLGGGRYSLPMRLYIDGNKAAVELFWYRRVLAKFNIDFLFERDEYDWVFDPAISSQLDKFFRDIGEFLLSIDWSQEVGLDLLKRIYQNVVPREVRRQLGEFYTPDWIAQLILWRALHILVKGSPPNKIIIKDPTSEIVELIDEFYKKYRRIPRFIDPTCGSFTFGVHYINSLLKWYAIKRVQINPIDFASQIMESVLGIDLNPVAIITAKVNYLLQIYRLLSVFDKYLVTQPILPLLRVNLLSIHINSGGRKRKIGTLETYYLGREANVMVIKIPLELLGIGVDENFLKILSSAGINISKNFINKDSQENVIMHYIEISLPLSIMNKVKNVVSFVRAFIALLNTSIQGFENEVGFKLDEEEMMMLEKFRKAVLIFEEKGLNTLWHSIVMNHLLAFYITQQKFDMILGNLPWVNVSKYPKVYAEIVKDIAKELNVSPPPQAIKKLDISIPLFAVGLNYLAASPSIIALMVPRSIFKGLHGAAWREYISTPPYSVIEVWDMEEVKPFEKAENQPGVVFVIKR
jgi:hypothetical protein